jgi:hypothetical protein
MYCKCTTQVFSEGLSNSKRVNLPLPSTNTYHVPALAGSVYSETKDTVAALRNHLWDSTHATSSECLLEHMGQDEKHPLWVLWH